MSTTKSKKSSAPPSSASVMTDNVRKGFAVMAGIFIFSFLCYAFVMFVVNTMAVQYGKRIAELEKNVELQRALINSITPRAVEPVVTPTRGPEPVFYLVDITKKGSLYTAKINNAMMYFGEDAITQAIAETGCVLEKIIVCAPTAPKGYYVSKNTSADNTLPIAADAKIAQMIDGVLTPSSAERMFTQATQGEGFVMSVDSQERTPFLMTFADGVIIEITERQIP